MVEICHFCWWLGYFISDPLVIDHGLLENLPFWILDDFLSSKTSVCKGFSHLFPIFLHFHHIFPFFTDFQGIFGWHQGALRPIRPRRPEAISSTRWLRLSASPVMPCRPAGRGRASPRAGAVWTRTPGGFSNGWPPGWDGDMSWDIYIYRVQYIYICMYVMLCNVM